MKKRYVFSVLLVVISILILSVSYSQAAPVKQPQWSLNMSRNDLGERTAVLSAKFPGPITDYYSVDFSIQVGHSCYKTIDCENSTCSLSFCRCEGLVCTWITVPYFSLDPDNRTYNYDDALYTIKARAKGRLIAVDFEMKQALFDLSSPYPILYVQAGAHGSAFDPVNSLSTSTQLNLGFD